MLSRDFTRKLACAINLPRFAVRAILSAPNKPTALACGSDLIELGAMSALEEASLRIPEDISVIGIDDISFAR